MSACFAAARSWTMRLTLFAFSTLAQAVVARRATVVRDSDRTGAVNADLEATTALEREIAGKADRLFLSVVLLQNSASRANVVQVTFSPS